MKGRHLEWTDQLSAYLSDELDPSARAAVDEHVAECPPCRELLDELAAVVRAARDAEQLAPPRDLWPDVARSIAGTAAPTRRDADDDVIALPTAGERTLGRSSPRARLAAAAAFLVATSVGTTWWVTSGASRGGTPGRAEGQAQVQTAYGDMRAVSGEPALPEDLAAQLRALEQVLGAARATLDPGTVLVLERSLNTIENAIDDSREALATDPGNVFLLEHLERMYRRKLIYLQDAVHVAEWTS